MRPSVQTPALPKKFLKAFGSLDSQFSVLSDMYCEFLIRGGRKGRKSKSQRGKDPIGWVQKTGDA